MRMPAAILASCTALTALGVPVVVTGAGATRTDAPASTGRTGVTAPAQSTPIRADLVVRYRRVSSSGAPVGVPRPDTRLRFERLTRDGTWVSVVSRAGAAPAWVLGPTGPEALANPFEVVRIELTDGDAQPRLFGRNGRVVRALAPGDLAMVRAAVVPMPIDGSDDPGRSAARLVVPRTETAVLRRAALSARYGEPVGRVRGLDHYVSQVAASRQDVLVDVESALPVELRTTLPGGSELHTGVSYAPNARLGHVRRLLRSELRLPHDGGRAITEVEVTDLQILEGARP